MPTLKQVSVFSRGGLVLVHECFTKEVVLLTELSECAHTLKSDSDRSIESRIAAYDSQKSKVIWLSDAVTGLTFILSFEEALEKHEADDLLRTSKDAFAEYYEHDRFDYSEFLPALQARIQQLERSNEHCELGAASERSGVDNSVSDSKLPSRDFGRTKRQHHYHDPSVPRSRHSERLDSLDFSEPSQVAQPPIFPEPSSTQSKHTQAIKHEGGKRLGLSWCRDLVSFRETHISEESLLPLTASIKQKLTQKNVTSDIADLLVTEVAQKLVGKKVSTFQSLASIVYRSLEESIIRILSSAKKIDLLTEVGSARKSRRPFVIAFVGVNGVGKSTSLSKVVHWLSQQNFSVMVAACDTFRAGAVEQLRTHCQRLDCALFERGYERDPSVIAQQAIQQATRQGIDVVMIDTAGRMQDNEPLMRALAKLLSVNLPDLTLFVGEALVGNDGVSQILQFEHRLQALMQTEKKCVIDGIFLSKFDTIDNKVGTALSLVYASSIPIMFVGTGQMYKDVRTFQAENIATVLLADS